MDTIYSQMLADLGTNLTALAVKGTVSTIQVKIKSIKNERNIETIRNTYDEIINQLLSEREEAIRIAQIYKSELDRIEISDDDIEHLSKTFEKILEIVKVMSPSTSISSFEQIKELISVDTLKSIQLLGFNYKAAIGEPLTNLCAETITSKGKKTTSTSKRK